MTSDKKIAANRINGRKSGGPRDTSSSRSNAARHHLLAAGITQLDNAACYQKTLNDLMREKTPVGPIEMFLVEAAALYMVRWARAVRLEGEFITSILNPPRHEKDPVGDMNLMIHGAVLDPGIPATIGAGAVQQLVGVFQRYESGFAHRLLQTLHELERVQRMRQGERVPAPAAADLSVHADAGVLDSTLAAPEPSKAPTGGVERLLVPTAIDVSVDADAGVLDSTLVAPEPSKAPTGGVERLPVPAAIDVTVDADAGRLATPAAKEPSEAPSSDGGRLPARGTEDVDGYAESGLVELAPAEPEQGAALTVPEVTDRKVPVPDPAPAWKPRAPAGPIWKR